MPQNQDLFDDDSLLPDWMRDADLGGQTEKDEFEADGTVFMSAQAVPSAPRPSGSRFQAPWDVKSGSTPPAPEQTEAAAPWEISGGEIPPPPARSLVAAPWQVLAGAAFDRGDSDQQDADTGWQPGVIADIESAEQDEQYFDWSGATSGPQKTDARPGLTGMLGELPWQEEAPSQPPPPSMSERAGLTDKQFTMSDLLDEFAEETPAAPPPPPQKKGSLVDRLRAASPAAPPPQPAPTPSAQDAEWLSGFGQAGEFKVAGGTSGEDDLDWLAAESEPEPPAPVEPPRTIKKLSAAPPPVSPPSEPALEEAFDDLFPEEFADEFVDDFAAEEPQPPAEPMVEDDDDLPWLDDDDLGAPPVLRSAAAPEPEIEPGQAMPDWLRDTIDEPGEAEPPPVEEAPPAPASDLPTWITHAEEEQRRPTGIRRISKPAPSAEERGSLTYEEWEQLQIEREHEAQKTPEDRLLEEVPDIFKQIDSPKPAAAEPAAPSAGGPEFVPGWFVGLEEKPPEDGPDWLRNMDYSSDLLSQPFGAQKPEPAPPVETEVPDWFKGAAAPEMDGMDWDAMFSTPQQPEPTPEPSFPAEQPPADAWMAAESAAPAEQPAPPADEWMMEESAAPGESFAQPTDEWMVDESAAPAPDLDLLAGLESATQDEQADWMAAEAAAPAYDEFDLPDLDLLADEQDIAPAEVPPWLAAEAPPGMMTERQIASPDEVPFPDLDLDQTMPGETSMAGMFDQDESSLTDLFDQMDEGQSPPAPPPSAPVQLQPEVEDFVERFDPLEPEAYPAPRAEAGRSLDADAPAWLREMADEGELPADLYAAGTGWESPDAPLPEEQIDWLGDISPDDVSEADLFEPAGQGASVPPLAEMPPKPPPGFKPDTGLFEEEPFDSSALDNLLGLYSPETEAPAAGRGSAADEFDAGQFVTEPDAFWDEGPSYVETGGSMPVAADVFEVGGAPDPGLQAMFAEAEAGQGLPDLENLFDDSGFQEGLGALTEEEVQPQSPEKRRRPPVPETAPVFRPGAAAPETPEAPLPAGLQPEWVGEMRPSDLPVVVRAGGAETSIKQKQVVELPDRLRAFRDLSLRELETTAEDSAEFAAVIMPKSVVRPVEGLVITKDQQSRLNKLQTLLDQVAAEEGEVAQDRESFDEAAQMALGIPMGETALPEAQAKARPARRKRRLKADRVLVALLLLVGMIAPFATDALHFADDPAELSGSQQAVASAIDQVTAGSYVLFAFEYGPTAAGELDPLAEAVLRDVLDHNAIPLITSTNPAGVLHAEAVVKPLVDDVLLLAVRSQNETALTSGEDYYILGYLPGEAVGVRLLTQISENADGSPKQHPSFKTDIRGDETNLLVSNLERDIALIVVVGEDSNALRNWAEQLESIKMLKVALVTASLEPLAVPYVNPAAYAGYLAGVRDSYRYDAARNLDSREPYTMPEDLPVDLPNPEESRWHSMALGAAAAAGLIALGLVLNLFRGLLRRRRR